ncbi:MAG: iron-sulfur cluster repair di-iron protein [Ignavibacteriae bacterium]|nr:iron-sulfur cluster repair di-iron protein [Ignavibacteriota bacterium]
MNISKKSILGDVVRGNFKTAEIFESYGIDFCCGGSRTIESACAEKNIDAGELIKELEIAYINKNGNGIFDLMSLDELIEHIVNVHHSFVSKMIPVISNHSLKVLNAHGKNHYELEEINIIWKEISEELSNHLVKEEKMLFPYIKTLVKTKTDSLAIPIAPFGAVGNPISVMEKEHASAGDAFNKLRTVTNNYNLPSDTCATFAVFYDELKEFEKDLHMHIHLENNILHPKAIMLEYELTSKK